MSKVSLSFCLISLVGLWPAQPADTGDVETSMLIILNQERRAPPEPLNKSGMEEVILSLRNEASETITAWKISCMQSENDGNFGVGSLEIDSFLELDEADTSGPIQPGDVREVVFPAKPWQPTQPYAAVHCGVTAVVLADARYAGVRSEVHRIFEARAEMLSEVLKAAEIVDHMIETGLPSRNAHHLGDLDLQETIRAAEIAAKSGSMLQVQSTLQYLRGRADFIARHIPKEWSRLNPAHEGTVELEGSNQ